MKGSKRGGGRPRKQMHSQGPLADAAELVRLTELWLEFHEKVWSRSRVDDPRGEVVACGPCGTPYKAVLHAVAVDCFYDSSPEVVKAVVSEALGLAASMGAAKVALTALATGYGRMSIAAFARGLAPLLPLEFPPAVEVVICLRDLGDAEELSATLAGSSPVRPAGS